MNVLFVSAILPYPLHSGGQVRLYNLLKLLSKKHDITLFSFIRNENERSFVKDLSFIKSINLYFRGHVWRPKYMLRTLTSHLPLLLSSYESEHMRRDISAELERRKYDCIHIEPFYVFPSLPREIKCSLVVAEHNIEFDVYDAYVKQFPLTLIRPLLTTDVKKIRIQEETVWKKASQVIAVSTGDASVIKRVVQNEKVHIIPNGVDTADFSFIRKSIKRDTLKFLFVGNFYWMPNIKAVEKLLHEIWPSVRQKYPLAKLTIVGEHLSEKIQEEVKKSGISYKEMVPDIRYEYQTSDMLLAPMTIAGGTKFKMLEAMASGCLVLTTKAGMEGINVKNGVHFLECKTSSEYLTGIESVLTRPGKFETITKEARNFIESKYDWTLIAEKQSHVWEKAV